MAVLKHTSPTASPSAPKPKPSMTAPSASTRRPVTRGASQSGKEGRADFFAALGFTGRAGTFLAIDSYLLNLRSLMGLVPARQGCAGDSESVFQPLISIIVDSRD